MIKSSRLSALSIIGLLQLFFVASQVPAQAQTQKTFIDPFLGDKFIAGCLRSYRFQDPCTNAARRLIADKFCEYQRYRSSLQYQVRDLGWKNRHSMFAWWEVYNNGRLETGFYPDVSSFRFTVIEWGASQNGTKQKYLERMSYSDKRSVDGVF